MLYFVSGCLFFFSCLAVCGGLEPGDALDLKVGHPVPVLLIPGRAVTLRLDLRSSEAEEIFLDAAVPDISYRISTNDGTEMDSGHLSTFGWAAIPIATEVASEIYIRLKTESGAVSMPGVRVRVERFPVPLGSLPERIRAAHAFNSAQPLQRSLRAEDLRQAIGQFGEAGGAWARVGDLNGEALALGGKAESEIELSRYEDARRTLDHALSLSRKNAYLHGWLLHLEARVLFDQWQGKKAKAYAEEELQLGEQIGDAALIALARTDLACVAFWLRDSKMGQVADQAQDETIAAGVPDTLAWAQYWKGWIEEYNERNVSALSVLNQALLNFRRAGDQRDALLAALEVAETVNENGDFYSALASFKKLDPTFQATGNDMEYGANIASIGQQYQRLNRPRLAEIYFRRADFAYARSHILFGRMTSHSSLCETEIQANEASSALQDCELALTFARQFGDTAFLGQALYDRGFAERRAGSLAQAFADLREAVKVTRTVNDPRYESKEHIQLGELMEQSGKHREALAEFKEAESLSLGVTDPSSLLEAQYALATWYSRDGQFATAEAELAPALEKLETARQLVSSSSLQASYFAAQRRCYELAIELRMREFELEPAGGSDALALELSERSHARGLLDVLSARSKEGLRERGDTEASLMRSNEAVDRAFNHRLRLLVEGGTKRDLEGSSIELTQTLGDLERAEDDVNAASIHSPKPAPTMTAAEIERATLASNTTFFEYELGTEHSYLWVIGAGKEKSYVLPSRERLENMVKHWRVLATSEDRSEAAARAKLQLLSTELSCALLADSVEIGMTRMIIVPDGALAMLPFAALPEKGCSSSPGEPLVLGHEITAVPSLSVFLSQKPDADRGAFLGDVAIVADPVFDAADPRVVALTARMPKHSSSPAQDRETTADLPRLLNAGYEASAIQATVQKAGSNNRVLLAQGFDANVETVLSPRMQDYRIWHLATHGVYDQTMPEFSGLVFSLVGKDGNPRFGFLKAHDIARLNVRAELVVLSACDSAAGQNLSGEGVMGLSYSFLRAGAKQVVSTLWSIDDAKSKDLIIGFYKELTKNGGNVSAALRQSQLTVMRQRRSSAPYYWAGFELTSIGK